MIDSMDSKGTVSEQPVSARVAEYGMADNAGRDLIERMLRVSTAGLARMFFPSERVFAFTRKRRKGQTLGLEGRSVRYSAIATLGIRYLPEDAQRAIVGGESAVEYCGRLIRQVPEMTNLGDIALVVWAAAELDHPELESAWRRLAQVANEQDGCFTVEAAWLLTALVAARKHFDDETIRKRAVTRLLACFSRTAGVFPHFTAANGLPWYRAHVGCFADQVYPIQALARYHHSFGHDECLKVAMRCGRQICDLQGSKGQWWWHYDTRNGAVVEGYPVYTVHQDSMAPMALMDLKEAGGTDYGDAIRRGLGWMERAAEVDRCLIDDEQALIWRSVKRCDPGKAVRKVRAVTSRIAPSCRLGWLDRAFPPTVIDYEDRPYHLGWILHTWLGHL